MEKAKIDSLLSLCQNGFYSKIHGYLWWKFSITTGNSRIKSTVAAGFGGQRIYIIPELDMVIVFTAGYYDADEAQLGGAHTHDIIEQYIVPSVMN